MTIDNVDLAAEAGLNYVNDEASGYRRTRRGRGFSYQAEAGDSLSEEELERIKSLAIPPAWTDVWISVDPKGHIQATGYDNAGRKQYIYHPWWEEIRDEIKFERLGGFGQNLSNLRKTLHAELRRPGLAREKVVALAVAVLDRTLIRVGNRRYAEANDSYGLTTLTCDHVDVEGHHVHIDFDGKGGAGQEVAFKDRRLASLIGQCQALSAATLFSYEGPNGPMSITSADVNGYLAGTMKGPYTAKDFRAWGATTTVVQELSQEDEPAEKRLLAAIDIAAERLGNTRAVCRNSYLHPAVPEAFLDGRLGDVWRRSRSGKWIDRAESAVNQLLANGET